MQMETALTASFKLNVLKIVGINDTQYVNFFTCHSMSKVDCFFLYVLGFMLLNKLRALIDLHAGLLELGVAWHPQILTDR